jgi:AcrR family transcriptional regulator
VTLRPEEKPVKGDSRRRRTYNAPRRAESAAETRRAVLDAARELFTAQGYAGTTISEIALRAGVVADTVYATVGRKPVLLRELVETAISGSDHAVPAEQRDYVRQLQAAATARNKLTIYAHAIAHIQERLGPVFLVVRDAAGTDPECAALWSGIADRRAANMRSLAAELRATGEIREDLTDQQVADVIWSMNATEYWDLLVRQRGWESAAFADWLTDAWTRLLLRAP